jgi:hypothetical protein
MSTKNNAAKVEKKTACNTLSLSKVNVNLICEAKSQFEGEK